MIPDSFPVPRLLTSDTCQQSNPPKETLIDPSSILPRDLFLLLSEQVAQPSTALVSRRWHGQLRTPQLIKFFEALLKEPALLSSSDLNRLATLFQRWRSSETTPCGSPIDTVACIRALQEHVSTLPLPALYSKSIPDFLRASVATNIKDTFSKTWPVCQFKNANLSTTFLKILFHTHPAHAIEADFYNCTFPNDTVSLLHKADASKRCRTLHFRNCILTKNFLRGISQGLLECGSKRTARPQQASVHLDQCEVEVGGIGELSLAIKVGALSLLEIAACKIEEEDSIKLLQAFESRDPQQPFKLCFKEKLAKIQLGQTCSSLPTSHSDSQQRADSELEFGCTPAES